MAAELATLLTRAITDEPIDDDADQSRTRILDAAVDEAAAVGVDRLRVEDVVRRSSLGRMTVYRRFPKREDLVSALVIRECQRFLLCVAIGLQGDAEPEERTAVAFVEAMRFVRGHPLLRRVAETDPGAVIAAAAGDDRVILTMGTQFIAAQLREASPEGSERAIQRTADLVARLFLSYIALPPDDPDPRDEAELHAYARDVLAPLIALGVDGPEA